MKKIFILVVMVVVALGLSMVFYTMPVKVKATVPQETWNQAGSGFELTSMPDSRSTSDQ